MEYKILEANGVENENVDGAAFNNFTSRGIDGRIKGILNECEVYRLDSSTVKIDTGELLIQGFRVKIISPYTIQRTSSSSLLSFQIVARITLSSDRSVLFDMECRPVSSLRKDSLFSTESGIYEAEIARFTTDSSGISSITSVLPKIGQPELLSDEFIQELSNAILEKDNRVHSVKVYTDETNPAEVYGGYWLKIKDRFLLASGDKYANGTMGGEAIHTLTIDEMPSHTHKISYYGGTQYQESTAYIENYSITYAKDNFYMDTSRTGGNSPHNNMPPYYAVNAWVRVTEEEFNANESL